VRRFEEPGRLLPDSDAGSVTDCRTIHFRITASPGGVRLRVMDAAGEHAVRLGWWQRNRLLEAFRQMDSDCRFRMCYAIFMAANGREQPLLRMPCAPASAGAFSCLRSRRPVFFARGAPPRMTEGATSKESSMNITATAATDDVPEDSLSGEVVTITFRNADTGYSVMRVRVPTLRDPVTVVGVSLAREGEVVDVRGRWKVHPQFGRQIEASAVAVRRPTSAAAIERYLASGVVPGIGPALAKRIVGHFGEDTFRVFEEEPERVSAIPGIGPKRAEEIARVWRESQAERQVMLFLAGHGITGALALRILRKYGAATIGVVEQQPYRLAKEIRGIGFTTADAIARKLGVPETAPERIEAGLRHVVAQATGTGHCGQPLDALLKAACEALNLHANWVRPVLEAQLQAGEFIAPVMLPDGTPCVFDKGLYEAEKRIARGLSGMVGQVPPWAMTREQAERVAAQAERACGVGLAPEQREAVVMALTSRVGVLTGGPGTGKTSTLKVILAALREARARVVLGAPTGKAAKRMSESTGHPAATVARLIGMGRAAGEEAAEIACDILILDEASMVDVRMLDAVLGALEPGAALLFVGDVDQLPSVGSGRVLGDMIESGALPTVRLTRIFRQAANSAIIRNAHRINRGEGIEPRQEGADFHFIQVEDPQEIPQRIAALVQRHIPDRIGIAASEVQVLSPMRKSATGTEALNLLLQNTLNPEPVRQITRFGRRYGVGDRVLQTVNNYDLGVMNGESGIIHDVDEAASLLRVQVDDALVDYPFDDLDQLDLAYAMTVHKSQGSQFPAVVMPVTTQHFIMLQRSIIYTGITRATRFCVLVGQRKALEMAIRNARMEPRITSLGARLARLASV